MSSHPGPFNTPHIPDTAADSGKKQNQQKPEKPFPPDTRNRPGSKGRIDLFTGRHHGGEGENIAHFAAHSHFPVDGTAGGFQKAGKITAVKFDKGYDDHRSPENQHDPQNHREDIPDGNVLQLFGDKGHRTADGGDTDTAGHQQHGRISA